jgi:hypothetical protein
LERLKRLEGLERLKGVLACVLEFICFTNQNRKWRMENGNIMIRINMISKILVNLE